MRADHPALGQIGDAGAPISQAMPFDTARRPTVAAATANPMTGTGVFACCYG